MDVRLVLVPPAVAKWLRLLCWILAFSLPSLHVWSQTALSDSAQVLKRFKKESLFPLPIVYFTPETGWAAGISLFSSYRFAGQTAVSRPSQTQIGFAYTQQKQVLFYLPFQIFPGRQKWQVYGELGYYRYTYQFFGIGNRTSLSDKEYYDVNFPRLRANLLRQIKPHHYLGARYWWDDYDIVKTDPNGLLANGTIMGSSGGTVSGAGLLYNFDNRDNIFYPTKGSWMELEFFFNNRNLGSRLNFNRYSLDWAHYIPFDPKSVLAANVWLVFLTGDVPFQQLAFIGGPKKMRGFFEGRLRGRNLWMFQTEYRCLLPRRFAWVAFSGVGAVGAESSTLLTQQIRFTYGAGIRYSITKKDRVNIRLDFAANDLGEFAPYLTVKEAF